MTGEPRHDNTSPPIGIDLGTTFSVVACLDESGRPSIIPNDYGENLTPSAVLFRDDETLVGHEAVRHSRHGAGRLRRLL